MKGSLFYVFLVAIVLGLFGSETTSAQTGYADGGVNLYNQTTSSTAFSFSSPGTQSISGTLTPGDYIVSYAMSASNGTDATFDGYTSSTFQLTLGAPVLITSSHRLARVSVPQVPSPHDVGAESFSGGSFDFVGGTSAEAHIPCAFYCFGQSVFHMSLGGSGGQPGWSASCQLRATMDNPFNCTFPGFLQSLGNFSDYFTVTTPTTFSATYTEGSTDTTPGLIGSSQDIPILPYGTGSFAGIAGLWHDPLLAYGYTLQMTGTSNFTKILDFPVGTNIDADGQFVVRSGGVTLGTFSVGQQVDFVALTGAAVPSFEVLGIGPAVNGDSPIAFPIRLDFDTPTADFTMTPINMVPPVPYCFGDGTTTVCPCGNAGTTGNGCASSFNSSGANLSFDGVTSVIGDSLVLRATGTSDSSVLYFQGTTQIAATFGDGLRCAGGTVIRIGSSVASGGASHYPGTGGTSVSVKGAVPSGGGVTRNYQAWYRNAASFCTPSTFNLTNGLSVTWGI